MLAGRPPFEGKNELEIVKNVKKVKYNLGIPELHHVSPEAKNLISNMMMYDPNKRISADEALQHNWIKLYDQSEHDQEVTKQALIALSKFNTQQKL